MTFISPWSADMSAGGNVLGSLGLGTVSNNAISVNGNPGTGLYFSSTVIPTIAANSVRVVQFLTATSGVNYFSMEAAGTSGTPTLYANGSDSNVGMHIVMQNSGQLSVTSGITNLSGTLRLGNSATTGINNNSIILNNGQSVQWINAAGTTAADLYMGATTNNHMASNVPGVDGQHHQFYWGGTPHIEFTRQNAGGGILFTTQSTSDHDTPAGADQCLIYTRDNAGKTELVCRFSSGVPVRIAIEP